METQPQKWGNSWAVRIPNAFVKQLNLNGQTCLDMKIEGEALILRLVPKKLSLDDIVASLNEADRHPETDWGGELGSESRG